MQTLRFIAVVVAAALAAACGESSPSAAPQPAQSKTGPRSRFVEVRVLLMWDEATQAVHRRIGDTEYAQDDEFKKAVTKARDALVADDRPDPPVTIVADPRLPWAEVTRVVNLIKISGIQHVEFDKPEPSETPK